MIGVDIAGMVLTTGEIDLVPGEILTVQAGARADEAHRVTATAQLTRVRWAAVDQATVMQAAAVGLKFDGHCRGVIALRHGDLGGKHGGLLGDIVVV